MGWPAIQGYEDGEDVKKDVLNRPLNQLAQRTEYLRNLLMANDRAKVTVAASFSGATPAKGTPVYRTGEDGAYAVASADVGHDQWFYAAQGAMAVGVVGATVSPAPGTPGVPGSSETYVVLYGKLDFADGELPASDLIVDESPETGRYFLSSEPGKLTRQPNGPVIYVANVVIKDGYVTSMLVSPQYRDTGESHVHREVALSGLPMGGRANKSATAYTAEDIYPDGVTANPGARLQVMGTWKSVDNATYTVSVNSATSLHWEVGSDSGDVDFTAGGDAVRIGPEDDRHREVFVKLTGTPASGMVWTLVLPMAGRAWITHTTGGTADGFMLNLGFYRGTGLVPPVPNNAAALVVDGLEFRSPVHGSDAQWEFYVPDESERAQFPGGPWLVWRGNAVIADSVTTPFANAWGPTETGVKSVISRHLAFHTNRMMVGPTGFVTSLQVEPGSPLRITDMTGAAALQGALLLGLAIDFDTVARGVAGHEVVKAIHGSKFETGPVVEKILPGPGVAVSSNGQGLVRVSVSNAHYAGDFETIALKNAKQDVAGGIFPYTKLLGWTGSGDIPSGFTARFRVPDYLPYKDAAGNPINYNVVVSASVFGEADATDAQTAAFQLTNYVLADHALTEADGSAVGSIADPDEGRAAVIPVKFATGYGAFDPVLIHGMTDVADIAGQRQRVVELLLQDSGGNPITVRPGYFVGLAIDRQGLPAGSVDAPYVSPIGFVSLRWNLVEAPEVP